MCEIVIPTAGNPAIKNMLHGYSKWPEVPTVNCSTQRASLYQKIAEGGENVVGSVVQGFSKSPKEPTAICNSRICSTAK